MINIKIFFRFKWSEDIFNLFIKNNKIFFDPVILTIIIKMQNLIN